MMNIRRKNLRFVLWSALLAIILAPAIWLAPLHADDDVEFVTDQVVVKLNLASGAVIADIHATYGTTTLDVLLGSTGIYLLQVAPGEDVEQVVSDMQSDPRLLYAEPNFIGQMPEGDPSGTWAWGGHDPAPYLNQYAVDMLNLAEAHQVTLGDGVIVAVLDTGAQLDHPQLAQRFTSVAYDFIADDLIPAEEAIGLDGDNDGLQDEGFGHGTHVAGIINLVAPAAQIMPLRVLDSDGRGNDFVLAEAIQFAVLNGADVINLSLGTPTASELLAEVTEAATSAGVVVVAAAGNLDRSDEQYPAALANVLAVTAVQPTAVKSPFANYGPWVDIAAPGQSITSTFPIDGYAQWSGTSMATGFIAGQAALIRDELPQLSAAGVAARIQATASLLDSLNPNYAGLLGTGLADVGGSLYQPAGIPLTAVTCGQIIIHSILVANDLTDCPGDGLVIGADGITVDLNGRTIDGVDLGSGIRNDGYDNVTIGNGTIQQFDYGVQLNAGTNGNTLSFVTLHFNQDAGILLDNAAGNTIQDNTIEQNSFGIILSGSTQGTLVLANDIVESNNIAVWLIGASSNTLRHNIISDPADSAIMLSEAANNNYLEANTLTGGGDAGIIVTGANNNELIANTVYNMSDSGIVLDNAHNNTIRDNDLRFNAGGVEMNAASDNLIEANNASYTTGTGIEIGDHSLGNGIVLNIASFNGSEGIAVEAEVEPGSGELGNLLDRNIAHANQSRGISVNKAGHTLTGNSADDNDGWGIYVETGNQGEGNTAVNNGEPAQCFNITCNGSPADTTSPNTTIDSGPATETTESAATFTFTANESDVTFHCALDGAAPTVCTSPTSYTSLAAGSHTFQVQAIDAAGNADPTPATHAWTITLSPPPPDCGPTITLYANADAWIEQNSPSNNKGDDSILKVKAQSSNDNFRALVRFPLPTVPAGCEVQSATLRLYSPSWKKGRTLQALRLTSQWSEMGVTWNNQPATSGPAATTSSGQGYRQWNVTTQTQTMLINGNYGFLIRDAVEGGNGAEQQFHAREKDEQMPMLIISFAPDD
jgi:parallel beta-helix repeat protein